MPRTQGSFADDAPLMDLFGKPAKTKIISVFVDEVGETLNVTEIARQAGVARTTVYDHLDRLQEVEVITVAQETPQGKRYTLNTDSQIATVLRQLEGIALSQVLSAREDVEYEK